MNYKELENFATKTGIFSVLFTTIIGFLVGFDIVFRIDIFPNNLERVAATFVFITFIIACSSCILSILLNLKKIAELLENNQEMLSKTTTTEEKL